MTEETNIAEKIREHSDKIYTLDIPVDDISVEGQKVICRLILSYAPKGSEPKYTFDWRFKTDEGSLAKRVAKYVYKKEGYRLPNDVIADIGNIANQTKFYKDTFTFDFHEYLDWNLGDFGDPDSCYWQSKDGVRSSLNRLDRVWTMRIYQSKDDLSGWGRAILLLDFPDVGMVTAINAYPKGFQVTNITRLIAKWMNCEWGVDTSTSLVKLRYQGSWKDYIWINGGNASVIMEGDHVPDWCSTGNLIEMTESVPYPMYLYKCNACGKGSSGPLMWIKVRGHLTSVCRPCKEKNFFLCKYCNNHELRSFMSVTRQGHTCCQECASNMETCEWCGKEFVMQNYGVEINLKKIGSSTIMEYTVAGKGINLWGFGKTCGFCLYYIHDRIDGPFLTDRRGKKIIGNNEYYCRLAETYVRIYPQRSETDGT